MNGSVLEKQPAGYDGDGKDGGHKPYGRGVFRFGHNLWNGRQGSAPGQIPCRNLKEILNGYHEFSAGKENLYLIGFMGAGKTTVAGRLKERRKIGMVEMDQEIQKEQQMTVSEIFERFGEEAFRKWRQSCLRGVQKRED